MDGRKVSFSDQNSGTHFEETIREAINTAVSDDDDAMKGIAMATAAMGAACAEWWREAPVT